MVSVVNVKIPGEYSLKIRSLIFIWVNEIAWVFSNKRLNEMPKTLKPISFG